VDGSELEIFEETITGFLNNINNLENEYLDFFDNIPDEIINEKDILMGIKKTGSFKDLNFKKTNKILSKLTKDFIFSVIEDLKVDIDIKSRKGINFSSEIKDLREITRYLKSSKKNIGQLMLYYREKFNEDLFERFDSKVQVSFYQNKLFWYGLILGFLLSHIKSILVFF
jgi:hypothetical protein